MTVTKTELDGTEVRYEVGMNTFLQDFKGSDLAATLNPDGETTVQAGAVDNTTNAMTADAIKSLTDLMIQMLPYLTKSAVITP